jgi:phage protein D
MYEQYAPTFTIKLGSKEYLHSKNVDVLSVSVIETADRGDSFSISMRDRHKEWGHFPTGKSFTWMDDDDFTAGTQVEIEIGYVDDTRLMMLGDITAVGVDFPATGMPTLDIRGQGRHHRLHRQRRRKPFTASTDSGIAEEMAREVGLTPKVDPTSAERPYHSDADKTYLSILRARAERINYEVVVKGDTLYFQKPGYRSNPGPALTLEWGRNLKSFRPQLNIHNQVTEVKARGAQTSQGGGKEALVGTAAAGGERVLLGSQSASEAVQEQFEPNSILYQDHNLASQEEANEVALAQLERNSMNYITGNGACMGDIRLEPRKVIDIKGIGSYSGHYYVISVTHTVDSGGYRCEFEVRRNAR